MEIASPGQRANGHPPPLPTSTIDPDLVVRHLIDLLEITLGASNEDLEGDGSLLSPAKRQDTVQRCTRFASESQVALYVQKDIANIDVPNGFTNGSTQEGERLDLIDCAELNKESRLFTSLRLLAIHRNFILHKHRFFRRSPQTSSAYRPTKTPSYPDTGHQSSWCRYAQ